MACAEPRRRRVGKRRHEPSTVNCFERATTFAHHARAEVALHLCDVSTYRRSRTGGGIFFFTVTLEDRTASTLTEQIHLLRNAYRAVARSLPFETVAICVLPDHLHALWQLPPSDADFSARWSWIKSAFSRDMSASMQRSASKRAKREKGIWQRRFWEHQIRDEDDLERHVEYIHYNPVKHGLVSCVAEWPYSSFHRYVRSGRLDPDSGGVEPGVEGSEGYGERPP
jgi:putative transposase